MTDKKAVSLTLATLKEAVAGGAVALRGEATLESAGGDGDKVFPPSHMVDDRRAGPGAKYALERRRLKGQDVDCVLLDSVQSQANRMEEALQALWTEKRIPLPVLAVNLSDVAPEVGVVTSLTAPHRVADALLRDSLLDGKLFRLSEIGRSFTDSTPKNAAALFKVCPTALVFGMWDSTGPKGGLGAKFQRAIVSEIVGIGATAGVKTASRIDPTGIVTKAAEVYEAKSVEERWTHDPEAARKDAKGKPVKFGDGKVSEVNHSNVPPTLDEVGGGVTIDFARHTVVLSLATLRKLQFGKGDVEARTALAALGLVALLAATHRGHDLRSRCLLVPRADGALKLEWVRADGSVQPIDIDLEKAIELYSEAVAKLPDGLRFAGKPGEPLATLAPSPKLAHLIQRSRELAVAGADVEGA